MRINLRHAAGAAIMAAAFGMLGPLAGPAAAAPGTQAATAAAVSTATARTVVVQHGIGMVQRDRLATAGQPDQALLPAANRCRDWDAFKYDSCRHDHNQCTFRPDYVYHDRYGRYNEEGYYHCVRLPIATPYGESS